MGHCSRHFRTAARASRRVCGCACAITFVALARGVGAQGLQRTVPASLSDAQFWRFITDLSEPHGTFPFTEDNFASNEMGFPSVVARLRADHDTGGAYLGVGPEQNFTYIAAVRPRIAFIVDVRRQAIVQHLLYKAIFELATDRAGFVSLLFCKPRPAGLDATVPATRIWDAYWPVATDTAAYFKNLALITRQLTRTHGFPLDSADLASLTYVYRAFYELGPKINYGAHIEAAQPRTYVAGGGAWIFARGAPLATPVTTSNGAVIGTTYTPAGDGGRSLAGRGGLLGRGSVPQAFALGANAFPVGPVGPTAEHYGGVNFASVTASTNASGGDGGFLDTEENYRVVRALEMKNLVIPIVGDFAGRQALRGVARYLRDVHESVSVFYTSNVEEYLFGDGIAARLYENLDSLPAAPASVLIRNGADICPIVPFRAAVAAGRVKQYDDALACPR